MQTNNPMALMTFPGQGSQYPGMLSEGASDTTVEAVFREAEDILDIPLYDIDSEESLLHTRNIQLSLLISGVAWGRSLLNKGIIPEFVLGLSVGAYPAAVISECISFEEALKLIYLRGDLMQAAYPHHYGMMVINGTNRSTVEKYVADNQKNNKEVFLANINSETQFVLSGKIDDIKAAADMINNESSSSSLLLDVPVPSHCSLLDQASDILSEEADNIRLSSPKIKYVSAAKARVLMNPERIINDLVRNMSCQVNWLDSCRMLQERGVNKFIQVPPGESLTNLCRRIVPGSECFSVSSSSFQRNILGITRK